MGNSTVKPITQDIFVNKLQTIPTNDDKKTTLVDSLSFDIFGIIISYSERIEQFALINLLFADIRSHEAELTNILHQIYIKPLVDPYLIADFNKRKLGMNDTDLTSLSLGFRLFFSNLNVVGKVENIKYLITNKNNIFYGFMHNVSIKKQLSKDKENQTIQIDKFVQQFKNKNMQLFNVNDVYQTEEGMAQKSNFTKKDAYKFNKFERTKYIDNISWKQYNDIFLKYLITNQLNFCVDDKELRSKGINDDINIHSLDVLSGCSFYGFDELAAYNMNTITSKEKRIIHGAVTRHGVRKKKVFTTTTKTSSIYLCPTTIPNIKHDGKDNVVIPINVLTIINLSSDNHIKEDFSSTKKILHKIFTQPSGFN